MHTGPYLWNEAQNGYKIANADGSTDTPGLCQKNVVMTCEDYEGYTSATDPTKYCITEAKKLGASTKTCYLCEDCSVKFPYNSSNCPSPKILAGDVCNGSNYQRCDCPPIKNCDSGISCKTQSPTGCPSGCIECSMCANRGTYTSCPAGYTCTYEDCSAKYYISGCATGSVDIETESCSWYSCWAQAWAK